MSLVLVHVGVGRNQVGVGVPEGILVVLIGLVDEHTARRSLVGVRLIAGDAAAAAALGLVGSSVRL